MPTLDLEQSSQMYSDNVAPFDEFKILIVLQKGVRCCTQHPITNHLTYAKLSTQYRAFTTKIDSVRFLEIFKVLYKTLIRR